MGDILLILFGAALALAGSIIVNRLEHARIVRLHILEEVIPSLRAFSPGASYRGKRPAYSALKRGGLSLSQKEWGSILEIGEGLEELERVSERNKAEWKFNPETGREDISDEAKDAYRAAEEAYERSIGDLEDELRSRLRSWSQRLWAKPPFRWITSK